MKGLLIFLFFLLVFQPAHCQTRVACSSNFYAPLLEWQELNAKENGFDIIPGASSNLYHQLVQGAPFQIFICSDPNISNLVKKLPAWKESIPLVNGYLVFWSREEISMEDLMSKDFSNTTIALADPNSAPFGSLAMEFYEKLGQASTPNWISGDGVQQVNQFIFSGSVDAAFSSNSLLAKKVEIGGFFLEFPEYSLLQEVHLMSEEMDSKAVFDLFDSEEAMIIWLQFQYLKP